MWKISERDLETIHAEKSIYHREKKILKKIILGVLSHVCVYCGLILLIYDKIRRILSKREKKYINYEI